MAKNKKDKSSGGKKAKPKDMKGIGKTLKCKQFKPKRDINGWVYFTMCVRQHMMKQAKGRFVSQADVLKQAAKCWKTFTGEKKAEYRKAAKNWSQKKQKKSRCPACGRP